MPKAQTVDITLKSVRAKLQPQPGNAPYFRRVREGQFIGYRPSKAIAGIGSWVARYRTEAGKNKTERLGEFAEWGDALAAAERFFDAARKDVFDASRITIAGVCAMYVKKLRGEGRDDTADDAEARFKRTIDDAPLGAKRLATLHPEHVRDWFAGLLKQRLEAGAEPNAAKQSANRNLANLKAALNLALNDKLVPDDHAWANVKPHAGVSRPRQDAYLTKGERKRLILEGCLSKDLANFLTFLAMTGLRPGAAAALRAHHWNNPSLTIAEDKAGAGRVIVPGAKVRGLLDKWCKNLEPGDFIFTRDGRESRAWESERCRKGFDKDYWGPMVERAAKRVGITATIYSLRHSAISDMVRDGIPIAAVAAITGTSIAMIERHYGHLASRTHELLDAIGF